jgi:membrane protease subunit (stomatin/prohibitin family)
MSAVKDRLLTIVLGELQDIIATQAPGDLMALNRMINEIEATALSRMRAKFGAVGLGLKAFEMTPLISATTTADDLRNMGLLDVATYQALQAADAMRDAAKNPGGAAGTGVGLGAGIGLGQMMAGAMQQQQQGSNAGAGTSVPQTKAEVQALLDNLDARLANGDITQEAYETLVAKWQGRLADM